MQKYQYPHEFLNQLRTVFYMMVGGPLLFFLIIYFLIRENGFSGIAPETDGLFRYVIPIVAGLLCIAAFVRYGSQIKEARNQSTLRGKIENMYSASIVKYALLETASMLTLVAYSLTANVIYSGVYIAILILFAMNNPTIYTFINDLRLPKAQVEVMKQDRKLAESN